MPDIEAQAVVDAHVLIGYPDQSEQGDQIAAPAAIEHLESREDQKSGRHIVAETVLAGKEIEEFAARGCSRSARLVLTILPRFPKHFFVRDGPGNTRDRNREQ